MAANFFYALIVFGLVFMPMWILSQSLVAATFAIDLCIMTFNGYIPEQLLPALYILNVVSISAALLFKPFSSTYTGG